MVSFIAIASNIHSGDNNFFKSVIHHPPDIIQDLIQGTTYCSSSHGGDNAIGAEIVTSVLYLDGSACMQALIDCFKSKDIS